MFLDLRISEFAIGPDEVSQHEVWMHFSTSRRYDVFGDTAEIDRVYGR
jgi:hypothetical protein